ncbi:MAG: hypothetical protein ACLFRP_04940 [Puniceicoccaceae bacterium]
MKPEGRIALTYIFFGLLWIGVSDLFVLSREDGPDAATIFQMIKGSAYVLATAVLIRYLAKRFFDHRREQEAERHRIFQQTIGASNHILRNYLTQMQLVMMEAESDPDFDRRILKAANEASAKVAGQLDNLGNLEAYSLEDLNRLAYESANGGKPPAGGNPGGEGAIGRGHV